MYDHKLAEIFEEMEIALESYGDSPPLSNKEPYLLSMDRVVKKYLEYRRFLKAKRGFK